MKKTILTVTIAALILSCGNKTESSSKEAPTTNQIKLNSNIDVANSANYDPTFLEGFADYGEKVILKENYLVTGGDTVYFPEILSIDKEIIFTGNDDSYTYTLKIKRTNLTNINYDFTLIDKQKNKVDTQKGTAILPSLFFFGDESFEDENGVSSLAAEYRNFTEKQWLSIKVAHEVNENLKYMATISYGNEEGAQGFELENSPVLTADL